MTLRDKATAMNKHTPGPWLYQGAMNSRSILIGTPKPEGRAIQYGEAIAAVRMCVSPESGMFDETAIDNARLIAAAPELLEALTALTIASEFGLKNAKTAFGPTDFGVRVKAARAAIAKATGG